MYVSNIIVIPNDPVLSFKNPFKKKKTKSERLNWLKKKIKRESKRKKKKWYK